MICIRKRQTNRNFILKVDCALRVQCVSVLAFEFTFQFQDGDPLRQLQLVVQVQLEKLTKNINRGNDEKQLLYNKEFPSFWSVHLGSAFSAESSDAEAADRHTDTVPCTKFEPLF